MRKRTIEELLEETGSLVLLKDIRTWVDSVNGRAHIRSYDCYRAAVIKADEESCVKIYILDGLNEHKEIVYRRRDVEIEEGADPLLKIKGKPLVVRDIEPFRGAKAKNLHSRKLLKKMGLSEIEVRRIQNGGMYELPTVGVITKGKKHNIVKKKAV